MSDIDIAAVDSLKVLDPNRPIREADIKRGGDGREERRADVRVDSLKGLTNDGRDRFVREVP